ncbi:MAG: type II toxin-antitoxin system MqsA family antitoxin [Thermodesulfobacteriota bacterium]
MKCAICKNGTTEDGATTIVLEQKDLTLVFKNVPAKICSNCGEEYISAEVNKAVLQHAREEKKRGVTLELLDFAA